MADRAPEISVEKWLSDAGQHVVAANCTAFHSKPPGNLTLYLNEELVSLAVVCVERPLCNKRKSNSELRMGAYEGGEALGLPQHADGEQVAYLATRRRYGSADL